MTADAYLIKPLMMRLRSFIFTIILGVFAAPALAELTVPSAAKFIDPVTGETRNSPAFPIEDGTVAARSMQGKLDAPPDATRIDLGPAILMPGFIDMHTHLTSDTTTGPCKSLGAIG